MRHLKKFEEFSINEGLVDSFNKIINKFGDSVKKVLGLDKRPTEPEEIKNMRLELGKLIEDNKNEYEKYKKEKTFIGGEDQTKELFFPELKGDTADSLEYNWSKYKGSTLDIPEIFIYNQFAVDKFKKSFGKVIEYDFKDSKPIKYLMIEKLTKIQKGIARGRHVETLIETKNAAIKEYARKYSLNYEVDWRPYDGHILQKLGWGEFGFGSAEKNTWW